jgi:hypothetical protein
MEIFFIRGLDTDLLICPTGDLPGKGWRRRALYGGHFKSVSILAK